MPKIVTGDCRRNAVPLHPLEITLSLTPPVIRDFRKKGSHLPRLKIISNISDTNRANIIKFKIFDASPID